MLLMHLGLLQPFCCRLAPKTNASIMHSMLNQTWFCMILTILMLTILPYMKYKKYQYNCLQ